MISPSEIESADPAMWQKVADDARLALFERLVLSQQPPSTPWQPVTDYSFEARKHIEGIHPQLIKEVFQPRSVLDYGCGTGVLISLLRDDGIPAKGYEPSTHNTGLEPPNARPYISRDLWNFGSSRPFQLVICREVLEHLTIRQIRHAVADICKLSKRHVYVTTRFAKHPTHLLDVDTSDDLDPTHITMLNQSFVRVLFVLEGFKRRADLEARMDHMKKGRVLVYERVA